MYRTLPGWGACPASRLIRFTFAGLICLALAACQAAGSPGPTASRVYPATISPLRQASSTPNRPATEAPSRLTPTRTPTPSLLPANPTPEMQICSPLQGVPLEAIPARIANPFRPPRVGSDDPHQGVDLADIDPDTRLALQGRPVQAVLDGEVVTTLSNRFPYGNAILIASPLPSLLEQKLQPLFTERIPLNKLNTPLTCPWEALTEDEWNLDRPALYSLYAHLDDAPQLRTGDIVRCGQVIGTLGDSGNALNPHLHLEMRVGPAGARFVSLAHYDASASPVEMASYCLWRVSGRFQLANPLIVLGLGAYLGP